MHTTHSKRRLLIHPNQRFSGSPLAAQEQFVYVRKESREASRQASLEASGQAVWPGDWHVIGPFENVGIDKPHPPEREIDLSARYSGKGQEAAWRKFSLPEGQVHSLKQFQQSDESVCYLYREIESPKPASRRVSLGSDDGIALWLNGEKLLSKEAVRAAAATTANTGRATCERGKCETCQQPPPARALRRA